MSHRIAQCPSCVGSGREETLAATTTITVGPVPCYLCCGLGVVRVAVGEITLIRQVDGGWERVTDAVSQLGSVHEDQG